MATPETNLTNRMRSWLKKQPDVFCFKVHAAGMGINGIPDLVGNVGSRAFYIEVKTSTGRVSPIQAHRIEQIGKTGAAVIVARTVEDVVELIENLRAEDPYVAESRATDRIS